MTIYNINLGIGWASSGVEYAQSYRVKALRNLGLDAKFIFMDFIASDSLQHLTANIGFEDHEIIWLYQYFTDTKIAPASYTIEQLLNTIPYKVLRRDDSGKVVRFFFEGQDYMVTAYLKSANSQVVERAEFVSRGNLIRKDYYTYTRIFSEYYAPKNNAAHLYLRRFYNEDGSLAYDEILDGNNHSIFKMSDTILYSKAEFIAYFMRHLNLTTQDVIIMDRATDIGQSILENCHPAKIGTIVHAEHYAANSTNEDYILWNNFYEYEFSNATKFDFFVTSTEAQTQTLLKQFKHYMNITPRIVTIPVGNLQELKFPEEARKPYSLMTASRLATEKHIDWLIRAVVVAKTVIPQLTFDIYGYGVEHDKLANLITELNAENYIELKGHHSLAEIYKQYQVYISGSTSEGFGLTLLEAVGSGLPIIGFDVPYGNPTFVTEGKNGYLIPREKEGVDADIVQSFANKIIQIYTEGDLTAMHAESYVKAAGYLQAEIDNKWESLFKEVLQ